MCDVSSVWSVQVISNSMLVVEVNVLREKSTRDGAEVTPLPHL